jgi:hypothetical protein
MPMNFEHDIMISYAWRDNQPPPLSNQEGWVSGLQEGLEFWLKQVMPRPPKVWRDKNRMPGNKVFAEELDAVVAKTAVLLAVLSEPYLASEWCERERVNFIKFAMAQGGIEINNDYRIFKINKLPVDRKSLPSELTVITGFDFFEMDSETRMPSPIDPTFGDKEKQRFIRKVYDVAVAIARLLKQIEARGIVPTSDDATDLEKKTAIGDEKSRSSEPKTVSTFPPMTSTGSGLVAFIPFTTRDLREVREDLVSELQRRNCTILPAQQFPFEDTESFKQAIVEDIKKADIAIHLIGSRYGTVMEGESRSVIELQNMWAAEESSKRDLRRLIWLPKDLGELTGQQYTFIDCLRTDRGALKGADLLEDSVENMKSLVLDMLKPKPAPAPIAENATAEKKLYIVHDEIDRDAVRDLRKALRDKQVGNQPLKLLLPIFDGEAAQLRELNRQRLIESDAVLIYWGGSSQAWLEGTLSEVRKAPGFGRANPFKSKHLIYLAPTKTSAKEDWWLDFQDQLLEPDIDTVQAFDAVPDAALITYLQTIR